MNEVFQEEIAPVMQRTAAAIQQLKNNNLMLFRRRLSRRSLVHRPGQTPEHQTLMTYQQTTRMIGRQ